MSIVTLLKRKTEEVLIQADEYICRLILEMTWGLGTLLALSAVWLCFG